MVRTKWRLRSVLWRDFVFCRLNPGGIAFEEFFGSSRTEKGRNRKANEGDAMTTWMKRLIGALAVGLAAADPAYAQNPPGVTANEIVIGLFGPLSGPLVAYGVDPLNAAKMIYDDVNAQGGIHGRKLRLVIEDDKCNGNELVGVVKKLVTVDDVFILHGDDYGKANLAAAKAVVERLGAQVVAEERIPPSITDITAPVLNLRASKPDAIISGAYPAPAVLLAQKYGEFGMTSIPLLQSTQGMPTPSVYAKNVGNPDALKNLYHTWSFNDIADETLRQKWVAMYKKHYPN